VRIFGFDPEVAHHVDRFGSDFGQVPLAQGRVHVAVAHLGPGGSIARHPAASAQLFCVVQGEGWAAGGSGERRPLSVGRAALWDEGEDHEVGTEPGLVAVVLQGRLEVLAATVWDRPITVADHDPAWVDWFRRLHDHVWPAVAHVATRIDHVGSTSVPGLPAKPIVDMDVVVDDPAKVPEVSRALEPLGYRWRGDLGIPGREAYAQVDVDPALPRHHLYCVVEGNRAHLDHVLLRDLLRQDPEARERYGELKRRNAVDADGDMDHYVRAKAALVAELLTRARAERGLEPVAYWQP